MIELREFQIEDLDKLVVYLNECAVTQYLTTRIPSPYTEEDAHWWITQGSKKDIMRAITYNNAFVGCIGVNRGEFENIRSGEIGYWIARDYWRKGIGLFAINQMTQVVFSTTDIVRLHASVFSGNQPSMQLLLKSGFEQEAILRKAIFKDGQFYDNHVFALLK